MWLTKSVLRSVDLLMVLFAVWKLLSFLEFSFIILALSPVLLESRLEGSKENSLQGNLGQGGVCSGEWLTALSEGCIVI